MDALNESNFQEALSESESERSENDISKPIVSESIKAIQIKTKLSIENAQEDENFKEDIPCASKWNIFDPQSSRSRLSWWLIIILLLISLYINIQRKKLFD